MGEVLANCIKTNILICYPLHPYQHAYWAGRSTETSLHQLTDVLRDVIDTKEMALFALLEVEGAFENTLHAEIRNARFAREHPGLLNRKNVRE